MVAFADHGLTSVAVGRVAREIGISQPYVFRLFGSKHALFMACLDELEVQFRQTLRDAVQNSPDVPERFGVMGAAFRDLVSDGTASGLWLQACALARFDDEIAARCRMILAGTLREAERLTGADSGDVAGFAADGALVIFLRAIGADLGGGSRAALDLLRETESPD